MRRLALLAVLTLASCEKAPEASPVETTAKPLEAALPADQTTFNKLAEQTNTPDGTARFCADVASRDTFADWSATVRHVDVHMGNRSVSIVFNVGGANLEQVVQVDNPLHTAVDALRIGDRVRISGRFTHGNGECAYGIDSFGIALSSIS